LGREAAREIKKRLKPTPEQVKANTRNCKRRWQKANPDLMAEYTRNWQKAHPDRVAAHAIKTDRNRKKRIPPWVDWDQIEHVYALARMTGLSVDHVLPLQGKTVSGLHVAENLQLMTLDENLRKHNREDFDVSLLTREYTAVAGLTAEARP
jgi:hypothetical protein